MSGPTNDLWCAAGPIPLPGLVWLSLKKIGTLSGVWWLSDDIEFSEKRWVAAARSASPTTKSDGARCALTELGYQWTQEYQVWFILVHFSIYLPIPKWVFRPWHRRLWYVWLILARSSTTCHLRMLGVPLDTLRSIDDRWMHSRDSVWHCLTWTCQKAEELMMGFIIFIHVSRLQQLAASVAVSHTKQWCWFTQKPMRRLAQQLAHSCNVICIHCFWI